MGVEKAFEEFWGLYPRKTAKAAARRAFLAQVKAGNSAALIVAGLRVQIPELMSRKPEFRPYPATWLNREQWADEPAPPMVPLPGQGTGHNGSRTAIDAARDFIARLHAHKNGEPALGFPYMDLTVLTDEDGQKNPN